LKSGAGTTWRLWCEVAIYRRGWLPLVMIATLAAAAAFQFVWLKPLINERNMLQDRLASAAKPRSAPKPAVSEPPEAPLNQVLAVLASPEDMNSEIASLFKVAEREGLRFERSSYQYEPTTGLPWTRVSISIPVSGSYPAVRSFVEAILREHPNMSLDQLSIQREASDKPQADVLLTFSAWFSMTGHRASQAGGSP
jgi:hypothetical protein